MVQKVKLEMVRAGNADGDVQQPENIQTYKKYVTLTADGVNIRKGAGTSYASLGAG